MNDLLVIQAKHTQASEYTIANRSDPRAYGQALANYKGLVRQVYNDIPKDKKIPAFLANKFIQQTDDSLLVKIFKAFGTFPEFYKNPQENNFVLNYYQYSLTSDVAKDEMFTESNFKEKYEKYNRNSKGRIQYRMKNAIPLFNKLVHKYAQEWDMEISPDKVYKETLHYMMTVINGFLYDNHEDHNGLNYTSIPLILKYQKQFKMKKMKIFNKIKEKIKTPGDTLVLICNSDDISLEELRFVASMNNIKNSSMMTKEQLCTEFKNTLENNKKVMSESKCNNETNMLGDDIKSILPSNFIEYKENGVAYCFDVTEIVSNKVLKNPYTRSMFSKEFLKKAKDQYQNLIIEEVIVEENIYDLLKKVLKLSSYTTYDQYVYASDEQLHLFIEILNNLYRKDITITNDKKDILKQIIKKLPVTIENDYYIIYIYNYVFMYWVHGKRLETLRPGFDYKTYVKKFISGNLDNDPIYGNIPDEFINYVDNYEQTSVNTSN